jgi:hypothetical protein
MTPRQRFLKTLNFEKPDDRLPMVEWAAWWDRTLDRWKREGLPQEITWDESLEHFGLDKLVCIHALGRAKTCPSPPSHGAGIVADARSYAEIRPHLYADATIQELQQRARELAPRHERGEVIVRLWLDGFFWFPRTLFGIERHLYAFYDQRDLMHRMNDELADYNIRVVEALFPILLPDMVGFAEDMSYNHGPMLSYALFKEFLTPYYQRVVPHIQKWGVKVLIDSDGDITSMIPWLAEAGIEGVYPLEKQAGVDIAAIRRSHPRFLMLGGYDKMVMSQGEAAMRAEFERLLPVMRSGGYIPSVDHQTPPGVSLHNYCTYVRLFSEYAHKAVSGT